MSDDDVIIIGTGAGGGTLAHRLAPSGKRILVLDAPATEAVAGRVEGQEVMRRPVVGDVQHLLVRRERQAVRLVEAHGDDGGLARAGVVAVDVVAGLRRRAEAPSRTPRETVRRLRAGRETNRTCRTSPPDRRQALTEVKCVWSWCRGSQDDPQARLHHDEQNPELSLRNCEEPSLVDIKLGGSMHHSDERFDEQNQCAGDGTEDDGGEHGVWPP